MYISLDPPAPTAVKVEDPEYCIYLSSNSDSDYRELKPATEQASPPASLPYNPRHVQTVQNATERYGQKPYDRNVKKSSSKKNAQHQFQYHCFPLRFQNCLMLQVIELVLLRQRDVSYCETFFSK